MNYTELLPVVVNALKEEHASAVALQATVQSQAGEMATLQATLATTQAELTTTKQQLASLLAWAQLQGYSAS